MSSPGNPSVVYMKYKGPFSIAGRIEFQNVDEVFSLYVYYFPAFLY